MRARRGGPLRLASLALLLAAVSVLLSSWLFVEGLSRDDQIAREGAERRDQMCNLFERDHLADVERLRRTYAYLSNLPRSEWGKPLTVAIVRQLPELEQEGRVDSAPPFCDEPRVGLPEPDPVLPPKRNFDRLLKRP